MVPAFNGIITSVEPFQILTSRFARGYWWTTDKTQKVADGKKLNWIRDQGRPILVLSESCFPNLLRILAIGLLLQLGLSKVNQRGESRRKADLPKIHKPQKQLKYLQFLHFLSTNLLVRKGVDFVIVFILDILWIFHDQEENIIKLCSKTFLF